MFPRFYLLFMFFFAFSFLLNQFSVYEEEQNKIKKIGKPPHRNERQNTKYNIEEKNLRKNNNEQNSKKTNNQKTIEKQNNMK